MIRQFLRVQRPVRAARPTLRGRVSGTLSSGSTGSTSGGAPSVSGGTATPPVNVGQSVTVKLGFISFMGNHGLEAGPDNTNAPLGAWRGTDGTVISAQGDRVLVSLRVAFSTKASEYWVRKSRFWRVFEAA